MSEATCINPRLTAATVINPAVAALSAPAPAVLSPGDMLADRFRITERLTSATGEADLYLCQDGEDVRVAKVYRRTLAVKPQVVAALQAIQSPYVAAPLYVGETGGLPFEVLPYYPGGSLQGRRFTLEELRTTVIPCVNEALRLLHGQNMIHKDLKPANLMMLSGGEGVAVIDFGVSSVADEASDVVVTHTGMTPEYSAPETFRGLFLAESDYYSFGVTLYELYAGTTPYKRMNAEQIAQFTAVQRIPFPEDMPGELQELIAAMTYYDVTNRHSKDNPNRRWTYEEVRAWCEGKAQPLPGEGSGLLSGGTIPPYPFLGKAYTGVHDLAAALAENWREGKEELYRGRLSAFFNDCNPLLASKCMDAEDEAASVTGRDDVIFWELLHQIHLKMKGLYWKGQVYESLPALGRDMLERLWQGDRSQNAYWDSVLNNQLLSRYLGRAAAADESLAEAVSALETAHSLGDMSQHDRDMHYYAMAYLLSGQRLLCLEGRQMRTVTELTDYMRELLAISYERFEDCCHGLIDYDDTLDAQLEAWLMALGRRDALNTWRSQLRM